MKNHLYFLIEQICTVQEITTVKNLRLIARDVHDVIADAKPQTPGQRMDYLVTQTLCNNAYVSRDVEFMHKAIKATLPVIEEIAGVPFHQSKVAYV